MKLLLLLAAVVAGAVCASAAELGSNDLHEARMQGSNGLASFQRLIKPATAGPQGFASTNEIQNAVLGEAFRVYRIPLDRIRAFQPSQEFKDLLTPEPKVIFPLTVSGKTKSSLAVRRDGGSWRTENWGRAAFIKELVAARDKLASTHLQWADNSYAVEMPVFNLWFLGYTNAAKNEVEFLTLDDLKFGAVTAVGAQKVVTVNAMTNLAGMAKRYSGLSN